MSISIHILDCIPRYIGGTLHYTTHYNITISGCIYTRIPCPIISDMSPFDFVPQRIPIYLILVRFIPHACLTFSDPKSPLRHWKKGVFFFVNIPPIPKMFSPPPPSAGILDKRVYPWGLSCCSVRRPCRRSCCSPTSPPRTPSAPEGSLKQTHISSENVS